MADYEQVKAQLLSIVGNTSGSHKDQADRYRIILDMIAKDVKVDHVAMSLKALVDHSEFLLWFILPVPLPILDLTVVYGNGWMWLVVKAWNTFFFHHFSSFHHFSGERDSIIGSLKTDFYWYRNDSEYSSGSRGPRGLSLHFGQGEFGSHLRLVCKQE